MNRRCSGLRRDVDLADRLEERQRLDVAHRAAAADLHQHHIVLRRQWRTAPLISSVMCGMTCTVLPRYSPAVPSVMTDS